MNLSIYAYCSQNSEIFDRITKMNSKTSMKRERTIYATCSQNMKFLI